LWHLARTQTPQPPKTSGEKESWERQESGTRRRERKRNNSDKRRPIYRGKEWKWKVTEHEERERRREEAERRRGREKSRCDSVAKLMWTEGQGTRDKGKRDMESEREGKREETGRPREKGTEERKIYGKGEKQR
jgi:hypothetical protein